MKFYKKIKIIAFTSVLCALGVLLISNPEICKETIARSIVICSRVLIPSLFPFSVCVLFIMNSGVLKELSFISTFIKKLLGLNTQMLSVFILSMLGGYPLGAKLINEEIEKGEISQKDGAKILNFCVNAGPAFIVSAVGSGFLNSKPAGYILLFSHIFSSLLICLFYRFFDNGFSFNETQSKEELSVADNFVFSAAQGASVTLNICSFVILFSAITGYIEFYSEKFTLLKPLIYLTEVTAATAKTNNIYLIAFLLGFGGICIWCQILSVGKSIKINLFTFALFRIIHGILSLSITALLLKIFKITLPTFSNNTSFDGNLSVSGTAVSISLLVMGIIFIISLSSDKKNIKILEEFT